jgi:hypothetical protein
VKDRDIVIKEHGMNGTAVKSAAPAPVEEVSAPTLLQTPAIDDLASLRAEVSALREEVAKQAASIHVLMRLFETCASNLPVPDLAVKLQQLETWREGEIQTLAREKHSALHLARLAVALEGVFADLRVRAEFRAAKDTAAAITAR